MGSKLCFCLTESEPWGMGLDGEITASIQCPVPADGNPAGGTGLCSLGWGPGFGGSLGLGTMVGGFLGM